MKFYKDSRLRSSWAPESVTLVTFVISHDKNIHLLDETVAIHPTAAEELVTMR
jgi:hypothetical protein